MTVRDWAARYIDLGYQVVPLTEGTKGCKDDGWMKLVFTPDDFGPKDNIGIRSVNGLAVSDADAPEAVALAHAFLPATPASYGRKSKPQAKRLYHCNDFTKAVAYRDADGKTLVEIRVNHQDMAPPSIHPSGEVLAWDSEGEPAIVDVEALVRAHQLLATAALWSQNYPPPNTRHDRTLAFAGALRACGLTQDEADTVITHAGRYAGDVKLDDRATEVRTTYAKSDDEPITGVKKLRGLLDNGKAFTDALVKIWGTARKDAQGFETGDNGKLLATSQANIRLALDKMDVRPRFDAFAQRVLVNGRPFSDDISIPLYLDMDRRFKFRPSIDLFQMVVMDTAWANAYHPVRDYLDALQWDGVARLDAWLKTYANARDTKLNKAIAPMLLVAAVRRVRQPGCKFDELPILISKQGSNKSSALRALCPKADWFSDDLPLGVDAKQVIERTQGKWIIEAAELTGLGKREAEKLKSFMSRGVDGPCRMAYGRLPVEVPRQFVLIGTTNNHQFLKDKTGNRRYWPIAVEGFDVPALRRDGDQLWAEAAQREAAGESIRLDPSLYEDAAQEQEARTVDDAWADKIDEYLVDLDTEGLLTSGRHRYRIPVMDIWEKALCVSNDRRDDRASERVTQIMQALGYVKKNAKLTDAKTAQAKCWCKVDEQQKGQQTFGEADE